MRSLTSRERNLVLFFGLAIFIVINLLGLTFLNRSKADLEAQLMDLQATSQLHEVLLSQSDEWTRKNTLLEEELPEYPSIGDAQTALYENLTESAQEYRVDMTPPTFDDAVPLPTHTEVSAVVKVSGPIRSVVGWLFQLQQPAKFMAVSNFSLRSDKEAPNVVAEVRVARWFQLDAAAASILTAGQTATATPPARTPDRPTQTRDLQADENENENESTPGTVINVDESADADADAAAEEQSTNEAEAGAEPEPEIDQQTAEDAPPAPPTPPTPGDPISADNTDAEAGQPAEEPATPQSNED